MRSHRLRGIYAVLLTAAILLLALAGCGGSAHKPQHYTVALPTGHAVVQAHAPALAAPKPGTALPRAIIPVAPKAVAKAHAIKAPVIARVARVIPAHRAGVHPHAAGDVSTSTVEQFDSVTIATVPAWAHYVAGYVDGSWPTYWSLRGHFPVVVGISVNTNHGADCFDMEPGNPGPQNAAPWAIFQFGVGNDRPCEYSMLSWMPAIRSNLSAHGVAVCSLVIVRHCVRLWDANWTYVQHLDQGYYCTQWTDHSFNLNLDESTCMTSFYSVPKPPGPSHTQIVSWAGARAKSIAAYRHGCTRPVLTTGRCGQLGWRVNHYQVLLDRTHVQVWRCFGRHANTRAAICQIVRPAVAVWSSARKATGAAMNSNRYGCESARGPVRNPACNALRQRFRYFDRRANRTVATGRY